jgi:iron complex outermembrane recepter protein
MCLNSGNPVGEGRRASVIVSGVWRKSAPSEGKTLNSKSMRERLLASTVIVGALALTGVTQAAAQTSEQMPAQAGSTPVQTAPSAPGANSGAPAFGPQAAEAPAASGEGAAGSNTTGVVTVTGSRIPQPNLAATSPITAVGSQELKYEGANDAIDALDQLPQVGGSLGNQQNPLSGTGITAVNLRNLGVNRTLVLQDGKRLQPGDPTLNGGGGGAADLDQIPSQLIDRVELVTGGASAVYGSDAIAGVVNFIMKHNFQGVQFDVQGNFDQHDQHNNLLQGLETSAGFASPHGSVVDGQRFIASVVFGANTPDGKGNVEGYASYRHQDPVSEGARDYSACLLAASSTGVPSCSGSSNSNRIIDGNSGADLSVSGHSFVPFGTTGLTPPAEFNSSPYEYLQREDERYQAGFFAHYQVVPQAELYNDFSFMDDRTNIQIAPSGSFLGSAVTPGDPNGLLDINCANPLLSAQQLSQLTCVPVTVQGQNISAAETEIGRRNVEGGARTSQFEHLSFRDVIGVRGDLSDAWHYDAYAQYGYTRYNNQIGGYLSNSRIASALDVGANGQCAYSLPDVSTACVPWNIFQAGGVSQAQLNYLTVGAEEQGFTQEQVAHFDITGQLGKYGIQSPLADRGVGINVGAEYRRELLGFSPDEVEQNNDLAGGAGATLPVNGSFDVYELFGEVVAPIATNQPFVKDLSFDGGYRMSNYSSVGHVETYKLSMEYAPVSDLRLRGSFNRAVRAPNVTELFSASVVTNTSVVSSDPCAAIGSSGNVATATLAQCEHTGVTAAQYGNGIAKGQVVNGVTGTNGIVQCPADQCAAEIGGNTNLGPERSDTVSYGGVFTPKFLPGFDFSVDYFDIDVKGAVGTIPVDTSLNQCLETGAQSYCSLVVRSPTGNIFGTSTAGGGYIVGTNLNIGYLKTTGIDFEGNYRYNLAQLGFGSIGRLSFNYDGTYTQHYIVRSQPGLGSYDCAGSYGATCGDIPRFASKFRTTYISPWRWSVSAQWRYIGAGKLDALQANPLLNYAANGGSPDPFDASRSAVNYFDLTGNWTIKDGLTLRAGVNNLLDRDPPVVTQAIAGSGAPNAFSSQYDLLGRTFFFGLTADF